MNLPYRLEGKQDDSRHMLRKKRTTFQDHLGALSSPYRKGKMAAVFGLVSQKCFGEFKDFNFTVPCVKELLVNCINIGILVGAVAIKLPQIYKIVKARSVAGISEPSLALELLSSTCGCLYAHLMGHPFTYWGETFFIALQCLILNALFWYMSPRVSVLRRLVGLAIVSGLVAYLMIVGISSRYLAVLAVLPITLSKYSFSIGCISRPHGPNTSDCA